MNINKVQMKLLLIISILFLQATAFWRHICHGELATARIDPLVSPGHPSQHVHAIHGASNFGLNPQFADLIASNCTSCSIAQDKSVYWSPQLYFEHFNGTYEIVTKSGGLTVYYFTEVPDVGDSIRAFPDGFRMIAGNSLKRAFFGPQPDPEMSLWDDYDITQQAIMEKAIGFNCLNYEQPEKTEGSLVHHGMRTKEFLDANCPSGMRAELEFPSCWNGHDLDSFNHTTHVAYPSHMRNGYCPPDFPIRLPVLFYETVYNTNNFRQNSGRFVFANGDPTGYGYHGDFLNGWESGVLQSAIDDYRCTTHDPQVFTSSGIQEECPIFEIKADDEVTSCKMELPEELLTEQVNMIGELPGKVQIQDGPSFATTGVSTVTSSTITTAPTTTSCPSVATMTSTYVSNGTTVHLFVVQEIVTTTMMADMKRRLGRHRHGGHHS